MLASNFSKSDVEELLKKSSVRICVTFTYFYKWVVMELEEKIEK